MIEFRFDHIYYKGILEYEEYYVRISTSIGIININFDSYDRHHRYNMPRLGTHPRN